MFKPCYLSFLLSSGFVFLSFFLFCVRSGCQLTHKLQHWRYSTNWLSHCGWYWAPLLLLQMISRTSLNDFLWMPPGSFTRAISPQSDGGQSPSQTESLCYTTFKSISVSIPPITHFFSLLVIQMKQSLIRPFGSGAIFCSGYYELLWFLNYYSKFMVRTTFPFHSSI